jgi:chromosome partitioning protein
MDVWALAESVRIVQEVRELRPDLRAAIVINRKTPTGESRTARDAVAGLGMPVLNTTLGLRVAYSEAVASGQGVTTYQPAGAAAAELRALLDELTTAMENEDGE